MFNKIVLFLEEFKVDSGLFILIIPCESISYKTSLFGECFMQDSRAFLQEQTA